MSTWNKTCAKCGEAKPLGPGGILCPECRAVIEADSRRPK